MLMQQATDKQFFINLLDNSKQNPTLQFSCDLNVRGTFLN